MVDFFFVHRLFLSSGFTLCEDMDNENLIETQDDDFWRYMIIVIGWRIPFMAISIIETHFLV